MTLSTPQPNTPRSKIFTLNPVKPYSWSYSKFKNFRACPSRHYHVDLMKDVVEPKTTELIRGDRLHDAMRKRVEADTKLPAEFMYMETWAEQLTELRHPFQIIRCEDKLALNRSLKPTGYFDRDVWFRGNIDYTCIIPISKGRDLARVVDYKTGKPKQDDIQLALYAQLIFSCYPSVIGVRTEYLWTEYNEIEHENFVREDMPELWNVLKPTLDKMELAHQTRKYPAIKNGLCKDYCPVISCSFNGK